VNLTSAVLSQYTRDRRRTTYQSFCYNTHTIGLVQCLQLDDSNFSRFVTIHLGFSLTAKRMWTWLQPFYRNIFRTDDGQHISRFVTIHTQLVWFGDCNWMIPTSVVLLQYTYDLVWKQPNVNLTSADLSQYIPDRRRTTYQSFCYDTHTISLAQWLQVDDPNFGRFVTIHLWFSLTANRMWTWPQPFYHNTLASENGGCIPRTVFSWRGLRTSPENTTKTRPTLPLLSKEYRHCTVRRPCLVSKILNDEWSSAA